MIRATLSVLLLLGASAPAIALSPSCNPDSAVAAQEALDDLLASHEAIYNPEAAITTAQALLEDGEQREVVRLLRNGNPIDAAGSIALVLARADRLEDAQKRLGRTDTENLSADLAIAGAEARLNDQPGALLALGQSILEEEKADYFQGLFTEALAADQIGLATQTRDALAALYDIAALNEQLDAALDAARLKAAPMVEIEAYVEAEPSDVRSAIALRALSADRIETGAYEAAERIAKMILRPDARALALTELADALPRDDQAHRAELLGLAMVDLEDIKSRARPIRFTSIAMIHARLGDTEAALEAADRALATIREGQFENRLRADALAALAAAGGCAEAQSAMAELPEEVRLDAQRNAWLNLRLLARKWR